MDNFSRVKFIDSFDNKMGQKLPAGTIGTKRETINDNLALVQYAYEDNQPIYVGVLESMLEQVDDHELKNINPHNLLPKIYHIGNMWETKEGIGEIIEIKLATNEKKDLFVLRFKDGSTKEYVRSFLENHCSYVTTVVIDEINNYVNTPLSLTKELEDKILEDESDIENDIQEDKDVSDDKPQDDTLLNLNFEGVNIKINTNGDIVIPNLNINNLEQITGALNQLIQLLSILNNIQRRN